MSLASRAQEAGLQRANPRGVHGNIYPGYKPWRLSLIARPRDEHGPRGANGTTATMWRASTKKKTQQISLGPDDKQSEERLPGRHVTSASRPNFQFSELVRYLRCSVSVLVCGGGGGDVSNQVHQFDARTRECSKSIFSGNSN